MRRLFIALFALTLLIILSLCAALFIGRRQPIPPRIAMLHLTDCQLPCWIGIVPGTTTLDEAQEKIRQVFDATSFEVTDDFPNFIITDRVTGESVEVWLHLSGTNRTTPIDYVVIMPSSGTEWLLADVHSFLYDWQSAIHVLTLSGKVFQHIYYDQYRVMLELPAADCGQSSIFQPVYSILFRSTILDNPSAYTLEWRGFHTCQP